MEVATFVEPEICRRIPGIKSTVLVLLVTDDPHTRTVVAKLLVAAGLECRAPLGMEEAQQMLRELRPDAMLVEVHLRAVAELVSPLSERAGDVPMVFVMGDQARREDLEEALAEGAADLLIKPFSPHTLRVRIGDAVRAGRTRHRGGALTGTPAG